MHMQYSPNVIIKLGLEVFIGDAGDPHITSPVEAQLSDIALQISKTTEQASDLQREQTLQREREALFRDGSAKLNASVLKWAVIQVIVIAAAAFYQVHHLQRFFRAKKLV
jgi:hypothetical protein